MNKWEYSCQVLYAEINVAGVKEYIQQKYPKWSPLPKHHIKTIQAQLEKWGLEGWELIHIEPVYEVGSNGDIALFVGSTGVVWNRYFFCVFKRPLQDE